MIDTERLRLRPLREEDGGFLSRVWGDPEVMSFCGGATAEARLPAVLARCLEDQRVLGYSPLLVLARHDQAPIGLCGFKPLPDPSGLELIYHFLPAAWGRGYATEAVRALLTWAGANLAAAYVEASFDPRNEASRRVLLKSGFAYLEDRWFEDVQRAEPTYRFQLRGRP